MAKPDRNGRTIGVVSWYQAMARITLKDIPEDLHAQLKHEAAANFRSLSQEALARIEMSFQVEEAFNTKRVQGWIDEAIARGPDEALTRAKFQAAFRRAAKKVAARRAA